MNTFFRAAALFGATLSAFAGSKIAPDVPQSNSNANIDVIVQYKTPPSKDELKQLGPYGQIKNACVRSGDSGTTPWFGGLSPAYKKVGSQFPRLVQSTGKPCTCWR